MGTFHEDMTLWAARSGRGLETVIRESLVNLSSSIRIKTPVDTGETVNNWQPTTEQPANGTISGAGSSGQQRTAVREAVSASIGGTYFYVNNVPWIRRLEYEGYSQKAPVGMVRVSIEEYQQHLQRAIDNLP